MIPEAVNTRDRTLSCNSPPLHSKIGADRWNSSSKPTRDTVVPGMLPYSSSLLFHREVGYLVSAHNSVKKLGPLAAFLMSCCLGQALPVFPFGTSGILRIVLVKYDQICWLSTVFSPYF